MDWFEIIIFAAILLFGLLFGDKKKKRRPPPRPRRQQSAPSADADPVTIAEQIFERMRQGGPKPRADDWGATLEAMHTSEAVSLEVPPSEERSLEALGWEVGAGEIGRPTEGIETLEPAGEASHLRFHERYIEPLAETPVFPPSRPSVYPTPQTGREAIVWMAVFGPPKGLP